MRIVVCYIMELKLKPAKYAQSTLQRPQLKSCLEFVSIPKFKWASKETPPTPNPSKRNKKKSSRQKTHLQPGLADYTCFSTSSVLYLANTLCDRSLWLRLSFFARLRK